MCSEQNDVLMCQNAKIGSGTVKIWTIKYSGLGLWATLYSVVLSVFVVSIIFSVDADARDVYHCSRYLATLKLQLSATQLSQRRKAPFTRYNLLSNRLSTHTGLITGCIVCTNIQPVVKPV